MTGRKIGVIVNEGSGRNARKADAIEAAMQAFGDEACLHQWDPQTPIKDLVDKLLKEGAEIIVAAGGDGTIMAVASAMVHQDAAMAVLPLGTFNFFARGLSMPDDPAEAARAILSGEKRRISVGSVNGQVFLNNASLGIYPSILKERETIYDRWGRYRLLAHWSVAKTFLRFQQPMTLDLSVDGETRRIRTPLIFVARSAFQLDRYALSGGEAIHDDKFALFVATSDTRIGLFNLAGRLVLQKVQEGRDVTMIPAGRIEVDMRQKSPLVAFDGEKLRMRTPLTFEILKDALTIIVPEAQPE